MAGTTVVQIKRGQFGADFQLVRALLSAASAVVTQDRMTAVRYLDSAISKLTDIRGEMIPLPPGGSHGSTPA